MNKKIKCKENIIYLQEEDAKKRLIDVYNQLAGEAKNKNIGIKVRF